MGEWREVKLNDITTHIGDGLHGTPKYNSNGEYYFINGNNLKNGKIIVKSDTKRIAKDEAMKYQKPLSSQTILLSINGTIGNLALYNYEKCMLGKSACYINVSDEVDVKFLYYHCMDEEFQFYIEMVATGTTIPNVPLKGIREYTFKLPPLKEQKAIAQVLSSLDDKIDLLHHQNKTLEELAQTLFRQWFVEEADEGREEKPLFEFGDVICGKTPSKKKAEYYNGNIPFIKIPDMHGNTFIFNTTDTLTEEGSNSQKNKLLPPKSICVSCIATVGLVSMNIIESQTNQQINSIIPKQENYRYFLYLFMKSSYDLLQAMASGGTATLNLNTGDFKKMKVLKPDDETLKEFHNIVEPHFNKIYTNQQQIKTLENMRDTLLPKLMSGEVRVKYD